MPIIYHSNVYFHFVSSSLPVKCHRCAAKANIFFCNYVMFRRNRSESKGISVIIFCQSSELGCQLFSFTHTRAPNKRPSSSEHTLSVAANKRKPIKKSKEPAQAVQTTHFPIVNPNKNPKQPFSCRLGPSIWVHRAEKKKIVFKFSVQFFGCTSPWNPVYHIKMNNGRFVSVIISFIVIYCVAAFCHTHSMCLCAERTRFFFLFCFVRSLVRSRLSFVPFSRIRINRVFGVLFHFATILHYCVALAMFCRTNKHMREEQKKKKRTHAYVTGEDECLLDRLCLCAWNIVPAWARLRYEFSMAFDSRFCGIYAQTALGRTWIEIEEIASSQRSESIDARFHLPQNTSTRLHRVVNLQMPAIIDENWLSICLHRKTIRKNKKTIIYAISSWGRRRRVTTNAMKNFLCCNLNASMESMRRNVF